MGLFLTWLARRTGVVLDEGSSAGLSAGVTSLVTAGYYVGIRLLEAKVPQLGWLLGLPSQPSYTPPAAVSAVPVADDELPGPID